MLINPLAQIKPGTDQRVDPVSVSPVQSSKRLSRLSGESLVLNWMSLLRRDRQLFVAFWSCCLLVMEQCTWGPRPPSTGVLAAPPPEEVLLPHSGRRDQGGAASCQSCLLVWLLQVSAWTARAKMGFVGLCCSHQVQVLVWPQAWSRSAQVSFSGWCSLWVDGRLSACLGSFSVSPQPVLDQEPIPGPLGDAFLIGQVWIRPLLVLGCVRERGEEFSKGKPGYSSQEKG